ncbi:DUF742 domain-containing protein [Halomonas aquamarina]|uniref:DUF742 domain-containing protein n=1 Tax=Vreelandella aquamarina TaxID=77097 RepID=A0ACC5VZ77_9GAMM|nr:hypothetical protein [Halomonas aquamarina]MBZ5489165.1 DUF742 domain-containing protein [Halomonas aquamarina]
MMTSPVMQPTGREVSAEAFREIRKSGKANAYQRRILEELTAGPMTRNQLAARLQRPLSSICGRCTELLDADLVTVHGTTSDKPARQLLALTKAGIVLAHSEEVGDAKAD